MSKRERRFLRPKPFSSFQRKIDRQDVKQTFLIVCEGEKTEPNYFNDFKVSSAEVKIVPARCDPETLVRRAIEIRESADEPFDQVWCVFDRDDCPQNRFDNAIQIAAGSGLLVACSIEAIELWFVLHFQYMDAALHRDQYTDILNKKLLKPYQKNSQTMYDELLARQAAAIRNSKRLLGKYDVEIHYDNSPSTTVFKLV